MKSMYPVSYTHLFKLLFLMFFEYRYNLFNNINRKLIEIIQAFNKLFSDGGPLLLGERFGGELPERLFQIVRILGLEDRCV